MPTSPRTLVLVDGSSNLYRGYYAIRGLTTSSGLSTNAVYGFTQMLRKLMQDLKPEAMAVAFDVGAPTFRHKQFSDYKKDRKPMPDDLREQIPLVNELLEGFQIPVLRMAEYEADDLIGTLAVTARDRGWQVVIATADKDFYQLIGPGISLFHTGREVIYDEEGVTKVFGLAPSKVVDVMAIWGDAIDGIPGVPGIGEKGAKALITEFGSLDGVYENLEQITKKAQRKTLEENRDKAYLSRELATIKCDVDLDLDFETLHVSEPDRTKLHDLFSRLEFVSLMQAYLPAAPPVERTWKIARSAEDVRTFAAAADRIAIHLEPLTDGAFDAPIAVALSTTANEALVVPLSMVPETKAEMTSALRQLLEEPHRFVAFDAKAQQRRLRAAGLPTVPMDDPMLMSYALNPGLQSHEFAALSRDRLQRDVIPRKDAEKAGDLTPLGDPWPEYLGERAEIALALSKILTNELDADPALRSIYDRLELPLVPVLARMEDKGIRIDVDMLSRMSSDFGAQLAVLETQIYAESGEEFNINSPQQLGMILFEKLNYAPSKKTQKTKSYSTGVEVLRELASHGFAVPKLILEHRELHKLKSTYIDALPTLVESDGRVHTRFNQAVAATGRLSSSDPNLQNIPVRTAMGREIRRAFIADEGNVLLAADYSQVELRILAHMSKDPDLIEAFKRGADIHRATAARIFNVMEGLVTSEMRRASKTINFGVLYGMSSFRLSQELGISGSEAKSFIESYFARYPRIREFLERTLDEARETGRVTTLFGRVRYIPEIRNRAFAIRSNAERMATNAPIQGTAADLLKLAMIALHRRLADQAPDASMLLTVHDEIVIETPEMGVEEVAEIVRETMENIHPFDVPLSVDTHWGKSWYEAKE